MVDIAEQINLVTRVVGRSDDTRLVLLRRTYAVPAEQVWAACTEPERIAQWFLPVNGDFRVGGRYQFEGNAGGEILACDRPKLLRVGWEFGDTAASQVEVRLAASDGGGTVFELAHTAKADPEVWQRFGPGAVGVGWDGALLGLSAYLGAADIGDPAEFQKSAQVKEFLTQSSQAWGTAFLAAGAEVEEAARAVANTTVFYVPE
jgi:uncharacterized protein YndB with AHSA1/START domain